MFLKIVLAILALSMCMGEPMTKVSDEVALQVGVSKAGSAKAQDDYKAFEFINVKTKDKRYLYVQVYPTGGSQYTKFDMSVYRLADESLIMTCSSDSIIDQCRIPQSRVNENETLMVGIKCQGDCQYFIYSYWSDIEILDTETNTKFMFGERGKLQEYHITVPDKNFTEFRITLIPETKQTSTDRVRMYGRFGFQNTASAHDYDFKSIPLWNDGQGIFLLKHEISSNSINLLVEGQSETVYILKTQIVNGTQHDLDLNETLYEHLMPNASRVYHVKYPQTQNTEYIITLLQYAGVLEMMSFKDQKMTQPLQKQPFKYQRDAKLLITPAEQLNIKQFYLRVQAKQHDSIFMLIFSSRSQQQALKLTENTNEQLNIYDKMEIVYIEYKKWGTQQENANSYLSFQLMKVFGNISVEFRICRDTIEKCITIATYENSTKAITHYDSSLVGLKSIYKFNVTDENMINLNPVQKAGYLVIAFRNDNHNPKQNPALAMVEYKHSDTVQLLRDGRPVQDIMALGEIKYFKFINSEPQVNQIKFHVAQISGTVQIQTLRQDPRTTNETGLVSHKNPIVFKEKLLEPVYIKVTAVSQAVIGISLQLGHASDSIVSSISLMEQVKFKMQIKPSSSEVFTLHPLYNSFQFTYKASGTVMTCVLGTNKTCENDLPQLSTEGTITKTDLSQIEHSVRINNPSSDRVVEIEVKYRSANFNSCEDLKLGDLVHKVVKNGDCAKLTLDPKGQQIDLFMERVDLGKLQALINICDKQVTIAPNKFRYKFGKEQVVDLCKDKDAANWVMVVTFLSEAVQKNLKIQLLAQYTGSTMTLPDGIAYRTQAITGEGAIGFYFYKLLNNIDTRVLIHQYEGPVTMYAKLIEAKDWMGTAVNKNNHDYEPITPAYLPNPVMLFTQSNLKSKCDKCAIVIAVYSQAEIGKKVDYSIEVVQNAFTLKDHTPKTEMLIENSTAYYQYYAHKNENVIIEVSDNNMKCATIYLSRSDFPSESNNIAVEEGNRLVFKGEQGKYYIAVLAKENCFYTIAAYNTPYNLVKLQRGNPSDLTLKAGQTKHFMFEHISKLAFKLILLEKTGQVKIYANQSQDSFSSELKNNQVLDFHSYKLKSTTGNALSVTTEADGFCSQCHYIVVVEAVTDVIATFILLDQNTPVQMSLDKELFDQIIGKDGITKIRYHNIKAGKLQIVAHAGQLQFKVSKEDQSQTSPAIKTAKQVQEFKFNFENKTKLVWAPLIIESKCLTDHCAYSLKIHNDKTSESNVHQQVLKPGTPTYFSISKEEVKCIEGFIHNNQEKFIISASRLMYKNLHVMEFDIKVGEKKGVKAKKFFLRNVLELSFELEDPIKGATAFDLCIRIPEDKYFMGMIEQVNNVNLLPVDSQIPIRSEGTFLVYPEGPFILDVFECTGNAMMLHGTKESDLESENNMSSLTAIGMPDQPHAVKMDAYTSTMFKIKSPLSLVRWMPIDEKMNRGLGYIRYSVGSIKYEPIADGVQIIWNTLQDKNAKTTKPNVSTENAEDSTKTQKSDKNEAKVTSVIYRLYVSNNEEHLKSATQCERFLDSDVMVIQAKSTEQNRLNSQITQFVSKDEFLQRFSEKDNLFFNVVADLQLQVSNNDLDPINEDYRMIYHQQQIPTAVFQNLKDVQMNYVLLIGVIAAGVLGLLLCTCIITKILVPIISRIRSSNLVEENADPRQGSEVIPPSSERNRLPSRRVGEDIIVSQTGQQNQ